LGVVFPLLGFDARPLTEAPPALCDRLFLHAIAWWVTQHATKGGTTPWLFSFSRCLWFFLVFPERDPSQPGWACPPLASSPLVSFFSRVLAPVSCAAERATRKLKIHI